MTTRSLILTLVLSSFVGTKAYSQDKFIQDYKVSLFFGTRDVSRDSLHNTANIDFMNYLHSSDDMAEYQYLGFSTHLRFRGNWEADIKIAMYDDFAPNNINLKAQYFPIKNLGVSVGFYTYPQLLNDFTTYHRINDEMFFGDISSNFRQMRIHETGIMTGIVLPLNYRALHCTINLNGGVSTLSTFKDVVQQKQINSNLRRQINYSSIASPALFLFPEIELNLDCFKVGNTKIGIQAQSSWYTVSRSIDYNRTVYEWTTIAPTTERIKSPNHHFEKFEIDFGIYMTW
jgi:hypothetical protein